MLRRMNSKIVPLLGLAGVLALAGCSALPQPPSASSSPPQDFSVIRPEVQRITPDDPLPVFKKLFSDRGYLLVGKDQLETTAERDARLAELGVAGTYVFQISPDDCKVFPFPDDGTYVIGTEEYFVPRSIPELGERYGLTVAQVDQPPTTSQVPDKRGGMVESTDYSGVKCKLWPGDLSRLPATVLWRETDGSPLTRFALRVQTADPGFRQLLREKKIGLAVRVRVGDLSEAAGENHFDRALRPGLPTGTYVYSYLPVTILEAWVVDTSTQMSVVHWTAAPDAAK